MFTHTNIQNEAFLDRFAFTYDQAYAPKKTELKILTKKAEKYGADDDGFLDNLVTWAEVTRKAFSEGAVEKVISTRRLEDAVKAFAMFGDRMKSVDLVLARFDESTREAFSNLYTKVDADVAVSDEEGPWYESAEEWGKCDRVVLDVPFDQKDIARSEVPEMRWDSEAKYWWVGQAQAKEWQNNDSAAWERLLKWSPRPIMYVTRGPEMR
jgi:hypothetical protein